MFDFKRWCLPLNARSMSSQMARIPGLWISLRFPIIMAETRKAQLKGAKANAFTDLQKSAIVAGVPRQDAMMAMDEAQLRAMTAEARVSGAIHNCMAPQLFHPHRAMTHSTKL